MVKGPKLKPVSCYNYSSNWRTIEGTHASSKHSILLIQSFRKNFFGFCFDFRAARSVFGAERRMDCFWRVTILSLRVGGSPTTNQFVTSRTRSMGLTEPRPSLSNGPVLEVYANIFEWYIPLLQDLDVIRETKLEMDSNFNVVVGGLAEGYLSITYQRDHAIVTEIQFPAYLQNISWHIYTRNFLTTRPITFFSHCYL